MYFQEFRQISFTWEPPLKAKKPKMRIKAPRLTRGMEWAIISTSPSKKNLILFTQNQGDNQYFGCKSADSGPEHDGAYQGHHSPGQVDHGRPGKVVETPEILHSSVCQPPVCQITCPQASLRPKPSGCEWGRPPPSSGCRTGCSH